MKQVKNIILILSLASGKAALADHETAPRQEYTAPPVSTFLLEGGFSFGGETVAFITSGGATIEEFSAGEGLYVGGGIYHEIPESQYAVKALVSYKFNRSVETNTDFGVVSIPLELTGLYRFPNSPLKAGLGLVYSTSMKIDQINGQEDVKFDDALGFSFTAGWRWFEASYIVLEVENEFGVYDANHLSLRFNNAF